MQAGAEHPFSTHIALNCNVGTRLGLQESECIETVKYIKHPQGRMYFVSGCQKKLRLIELAAATCYLQFCRATARTGPEEMTHWHPGGRFKESFSSNGFHNIYSIILSRIISRYVPFHQMSF